MTLADFINLALNGLVEGLLIALPALAVTLVHGLARFPNAATGDVVAAGGFGGYLSFNATGSLLLAGLGGALVGAIVSLASYYLAFKAVMRRSVITLLLTSIGVGFFIRAVMGLSFGHELKMFSLPLTRSLNFDGIMLNPTDATLAGIILAVLAAVFAMLYVAPVGRMMRALADDPDLGRVSGIRNDRVMLIMWSVTGAVCGIAGTVLGMRTVLSPEMGWAMLLPAFAAAVIGGLGNPVGAVAGALLLGVVQELSTPVVGFVYKIALAYVVMLLVLLVRPQGLFNRPQGVR
ncbi:branched-chain amino acid ABC transporter permease [Herbaspirillum sp. RTI4]|uniref:branched-chain amino acid ABC transporter permease n=1 Tax=Herbaspirillum sp. RTI4 TaxID=3048640 RepID=UPI002AB3CE0A|nr:branched-chain amino acid ABC transporter permease [Herbaspirillum sp. RTI4]MDY7577213.1 branched-chain amino acid ABC transporter permease [Herbaspirillum sp. RTI4]MEA9980503.1 branched-chain amino acid ABC transporter permease [Herbaspirillum sp. RTI4]